MASTRRTTRSTAVTRINIGTIIFLVFALYVAIFVIIYFNKTHLSIYEVQAESLAGNNQAEAVIVRQETAVKTDIAGYVNYYRRSGKRVARSETIYSIDDSRQIYELISGADIEYSLSEADVADIKANINDFSKDYAMSDYSDLYALKDDLSTTMKSIYDSYLLDNLHEILENTGSTSSLTVSKAPSAGIVSYFSDTLDGLTVEQVTPDTFDKSRYESENLFDSELKEAGSTIYKLLTNEKWTMIINLSKEQYESLSSQSRITFTIDTDSLTLTLPVDFYSAAGGYFARVDMNQYLIRYIDMRFLDITIDMSAEHGLKIPVSSIVEKEFYLIPVEYLTKGDNSTDSGVVKLSHDVNTGETLYEFIATDIYFQDEQYAYVETDLFTYGSFIYNMNSEEQFQISLVGKLEGVYCVNKGYAQFRRIERLYDGNEYCIVKAGMSQSINEYDHIVQDATQIDELEIIY